MSRTFDQSLAVGHLGEKRVFDCLAEAQWFVKWDNDGPKRDIIATPPFAGGVQERIEVKNEDKFAERPNACIELYQRKTVPSGLQTTEATVVVHTLAEMVLVYRKQPCLNWILQRLQSGQSKLADFGDNGNRGVLEPQILIGMKDFANYIPLSELPHSRVFLR
jgi:hypothetical protein